MAVHLTPTELADESGLDRQDVIERCVALGVPIFQGRIDKTLFIATVARAEQDAARAGSAVA